MKKINNYISEKLHINKNSDHKDFRIGAKVRWGSSTHYELADYIRIDSSSEDELIKFIKKYADNKSVWSQEFRHNKICGKNKQSLNNYEYLIAIRNIKFNDYTEVYFLNEEMFKIYD